MFVGKKAGVDAEALGGGGEGEKGGSFIGGSAAKKTGARAKKTEWIERRDSNLARPSGTRAALGAGASVGSRGGGGASRRGGVFERGRF